MVGPYMCLVHLRPSCTLRKLQGWILEQIPHFMPALKPLLPGRAVLELRTSSYFLEDHSTRAFSSDL